MKTLYPINLHPSQSLGVGWKWKQLRLVSSTVGSNEVCVGIRVGWIQHPQSVRDSSWLLPSMLWWMGDRVQIAVPVRVLWKDLSHGPRPSVLDAWLTVWAPVFAQLWLLQFGKILELSFNYRNNRQCTKGGGEWALMFSLASFGGAFFVISSCSGWEKVWSRLNQHR